MRTIAASVALLLVASSPLFAQGRGDRPAPVVSPEVTPDRMVTFRLRAPDAEKVIATGAEALASAAIRLMPNGES